MSLYISALSATAIAGGGNIWVTLLNGRRALVDSGSSHRELDCVTTGILKDGPGCLMFSFVLLPSFCTYSAVPLVKILLKSFLHSFLVAYEYLEHW